MPNYIMHSYDSLFIELSGFFVSFCVSMANTSVRKKGAYSITIACPDNSAATALVCTQFSV